MRLNERTPWLLSIGRLATVAACIVTIALPAPAHAKKPKHDYILAQGYANTAPVAQAKVQRLLVNPFGEVDGLLLDGNVLVTFPPHMAAELIAVAKTGDQVAVHGIPAARGQFKGLVIRNVATNQVVTEHPPAFTDRKMPKHLRAIGLKELSAQGGIVALRHGKRGEVNGVVLEDGTSVRFAKEAVWTAAPLLQIGQAIAVTGYGTETAHGRGIEATALGKQGETPRPIYRR